MYVWSAIDWFFFLQPQEALKYYNELLERKYTPTASTLMSMMRVFGKKQLAQAMVCSYTAGNGYTHGSQSYFEKSKSLKMAKVQSFDLAIQLCYEAGDYKQAIARFECVHCPSAL